MPWATGLADTGERVHSDDTDVFIEGSNLDTNKARLLIIASMMKCGLALEVWAVGSRLRGNDGLRGLFS